MQLYIVRHGQSANNVIQHLSQRHQDPLLTLLGQQQAEATAAFLGGGGHLAPAERAGGGGFVDRLYCSPMRRALQTARPCGRALGLAPEVWVELHEIGGIYLDHGGAAGTVGYSGQTRRQVLDEFPEYVLPDRIGDDGWWNLPMEEPHQGHGRALAVAAALRQRAGSPQRVALVTHGDFADALLKALWGRLPGEGLYWEHANTGISSLELRPDAPLVVRYLNRVDHLPAPLRS